MKIKKNDNVQVISGKDKGKSGEVLAVIKEENRIVVKGINIAKKHVKPRGKEPGGIIEIERAFNISNAMLICPACKKPTRVGFEISDGKKSRVCKKCNKSIK